MVLKISVDCGEFDPDRYAVAGSLKPATPVGQPLADERGGVMGGRSRQAEAPGRYASQYTAIRIESSRREPCGGSLCRFRDGSMSQAQVASHESIMQQPRSNFYGEYHAVSYDST